MSNFFQTQLQTLNTQRAFVPITNRQKWNGSDHGQAQLSIDTKTPPNRRVKIGACLNAKMWTGPSIAIAQQIKPSNCGTNG